MSTIGGEVVLSKGKLGFQRVLDDFPNADTIWICTFNLSKQGPLLLRALEALPAGVNVHVVCSIPGRWDTYYSTDVSRRAAVEIRRYTRRLDPVRFDASVDTYFNFQNHAKLVATENIAYLGSANFSDDSARNYEAGILVTNADDIQKLVHDVFEPIRDASVQYLGKAGDRLLVQLHETQQTLDAVIEDLEMSFYPECDWPPAGDLGFIVPQDAPSVLGELERVVDELDELTEHDGLGATVSEAIAAYLKGEALVALEQACSKHTDLGKYLRFDVTSSVLAEVEGNIDAYDENLDPAIESATDRALEQLDAISDRVSEDDVKDLLEAVNTVRGQVTTLLEQLTIIIKAAQGIDNT